MNFARCHRSIDTDTWLSVASWCAVVALLILLVPLFLWTPINSDAIYYDLQAQCVQQGGVLYRDMLETNLPGAVWIHWLVRAIGGQSPVALRGFDLLVFASIVGLLAFCTTDGERKRQFATLTLATSLFYLPLTPWSHCQRDLWMLLPSLVALLLRSEIIQSFEASSPRRLLALSVLEGLMWGTAFWIKPHVAVPALIVILFSTSWTGWSRRLLLSLSCVLAGSMLIGAVGSSWLIATGAWAHFWDTQLHWNTEYLAAREHWSALDRCIAIFGDLRPWSWLHIIALPCASIALYGQVTSSASQSSKGNRSTLISALYVGWMLQIATLQHTFAYIQVPGIILAIAVVASWPWPSEWAFVRRSVSVAILLLAAATSVGIKPDRLLQWSQCVTPVFSPADRSLKLRAALNDRPDQLWEEYPAVLSFLMSQNVSGQDVFVFHWSNLSIYPDLQLTPPHRFVIADSHLMLFPSQAKRIRMAIEQSPYRFVVTDLGALGIGNELSASLEREHGMPLQLPSSVTSQFPYSLPIIFRSGTLCVHERPTEMQFTQPQIAAR